MGTDRKAYHLRWHNHIENMRSLFETSYCDQALVDVTISCPDGKLKAHKLVLSACSPYFESVFKENPCKHPVLIMKGISFKEMSYILEYIYKGEVDILDTELQALISTANDLQIRGLSNEYQIDTTIESHIATQYPLLNSPVHHKGIRTGDMAPVATPKSQSQVNTKVPESAATALVQEYDMDSESMSRQRPQKRAAGKPSFDSVKVTTECENYFNARQLVTPALPKAPNSNLPAGICSPSVGQPSLQNSSTSSPIGLTVPSVSLLSGLMAARNSASPSNKYGSTPNGVANCEATNLSVNRHGDDKPTDLTSASNGVGNLEDDERREIECDEQDDDDENELHIDTSRMEVSFKAEMDEDEDTIGYLCESTFTEGETTNGLSSKTDMLKDGSDGIYEKEGTVCPFCFRDCRTSDALKRHIRIHTSQKPHQCEYCQLAFARSSHLERHRRTHTGERPFVCPISSCSKRFARQDKVKQHVTRHHTGLPRPVRQSSPKTYKPRAAPPVPIQTGGKRPRGRPRKHPSPGFIGGLYHGHTLLDEGSPNHLSGSLTPSVSISISENMTDPLTSPPAKDFANLSARNSPADFLQRESDSCTTANESLSTLELSVSTQEHVQGLNLEPVANPPENVADTTSVGT